MKMNEALMVVFGFVFAHRHCTAHVSENCANLSSVTRQTEQQKQFLGPLLDFAPT